MARIDPPVQSYMTRILKRLGVPVTPQNVSFMAGWAQREGVPQNIDRFNYLGTTLPMDGSYGTNAPGVQSYPSEDAGVRAHASMLNQSNFTALRRMLAGGDPYKLREDPRVQAAFRLWSGGGYSWPLHGDAPAGGGSAPLASALKAYPTSITPDSVPEPVTEAPTAPQAPSGGISPERLALLTDRLSRGGGFGSRYPEVAAQLLQRRLGGAADVRIAPPGEDAAPSFPASSGNLGGAPPITPESNPGAPARSSQVAYSQGDSRWANVPYGGKNLASSGCGPSAVATTITSLTGRQVTPPDVAKWAGNRYYVPGVGSSWQLFPDAAAAFGLNYRSIGTNLDAAREVLRNGGKVIAAGSGDFFGRRTNGHILVIRSIDEKGNFYVADSAGRDGFRAFTPAEAASGLMSLHAITKGKP